MEELQGTYPLPIGGNQQQFTTNSSQPEDLVFDVENFLELSDSDGSLTQQQAGHQYTTADIARIDAMEDSLRKAIGLTQLQLSPPTSDDMEVNTAVEMLLHHHPELLGSPELCLCCPVGHPNLAQPDPDPYSAATADGGSNAVEVVGFLQQPGTGRVSGNKRKKWRLTRTSAGRSKAPEFNLAESHAGRDQLDPDSHHDIDIKNKPPPDCTTPAGIFNWLTQISLLLHFSDNSKRWDWNRTAAMNDQVRPNAVRRYVTSERMPTNRFNNSNWEEIDYKVVRTEHNEDKFVILNRFAGIIRTQQHKFETQKRFFLGIIRTLKFLRDDDGKVFYMREYIPTDYWGRDLYILKGLYFREVFTTTNEVPGVPAPPPQVNAKNKTAPVKHRMRGDNDTFKGESPVWKHFIKVYDKHPEEEGSEVVYAVCCDCHRMLKAGNGHGTTSLSRHRRQLHQASTSSSQSQATNLSGIQPTDLCGVP